MRVRVRGFSKTTWAQGRLGFAFRREAGGAAELFDFTSSEKGKKTPTEPFVFMRWSASDGVRERHNPVHLLGSCPGFGFEVPPGKKYGLVIALGSYLEGFQTNGLDGRYLYTRYFKGLADVLKTALDRAGRVDGEGRGARSETGFREALRRSALHDRARDAQLLRKHATAGGRGVSRCGW